MTAATWLLCIAVAGFAVLGAGAALSMLSPVRSNRFAVGNGLLIAGALIVGWSLAAAIVGGVFEVAP